MSLTGIGEAAQAIKGIVDKFVPDADEKIKSELSVQLASLQAQQASRSAQAGTNTAEAKNPSLFVSGWRPFVGWVCGCGFAMSFLGPCLQWLFSLWGLTVAFPELDTQTLLTLLLGMLGLGGYHTYEKVKHVPHPGA